MTWKRLNLTGKTFGKLLVLESYIEMNEGDNKGRTQCICKCDCGNTKIVLAKSLNTGRVNSCGCLKGQHLITHAHSGTKILKVYYDMLSRCYNKKNKHYKTYGGRGIKVCPRWKESFENFLEDVGEIPFPKAQIDRKDNDRGYFPKNCKWSTRTENMRNRQNTMLIKYKGKTKTTMGWSEITGIPAGTIKSRLFRNNWTIAKTLTTLSRKCVNHPRHTKSK